MLDEYGHVKISRRAYQTDPLWLERRVFSQWEAWEWLIQAAAWKDYQKSLKKSVGVVTIRRGETPPLSLRHLGDVWGWGKNKVSRFLEMMGDGQLARIRDSQRTSDGDTYVIINYDTYQGSRDTCRDTERDRGGTGAGQGRDEEEAVKQLSNSLPTGERNTHTPARVKGTPASKRCPETWEPNDGHRQLALSLGVDLLSELEFFRDYTFANARKDWDATFRNWLRTAAEKQSRFNGNGKHTPESTNEDSGELQRRRQQETENAEAEYQAQRAAWKKMIAERWEGESPDVRNRIRSQSESEFQALRGDQARFKRAVDARAVQLYADEINLPSPSKRPL